MERQRRQIDEKQRQEVSTGAEQPEAENAEHLSPGVYVEEVSLKTPVDGEGNPLDVLAAVPDDNGSQASLHGYGTVSGLELTDDSDQSAYIGETEKNLSQQLDNTQDAGETMFFDEADALFGKRTEVHDSHDKYANQEVSNPGEEAKQGFRPEIGDEVVVEPTKLVEALGSEIIVHQREEPDFTTQINEEAELVSDKDVSGNATGAGDLTGSVEVPADKAEEVVVDQQEQPTDLDPMYTPIGFDGQGLEEEAPPGAAPQAQADLNFEEIKWVHEPAEVWKAPAGIGADIVGAKVPEEQTLDFTIDSTDMTAQALEEPESGAGVDNVGQQDAFMEQANPLSEHVAEMPLPDIEMEPLSLDVEGDQDTTPIDEDDDPLDVI